MITIKEINGKWMCEAYNAIHIGDRREEKKITAYGDDPFEAVDNYGVAYKTYLISLGLERREPPHY